MSMSNYTEISTAVATWLNREGFSSLTDQVEDLIAMGQRRIHRLCDLNAMEEVVTLTIDEASESVPADFLRTKSMTIIQSNATFEVNGAPHTLVMDYSSTDRPTKYSVIGSSFYFGPPPDQEYSAQLVYYKSLDILSTTNTTNWFSANAPEFLLYAALVEACLFLKDDARAQVWETRFNQVKDELLQSEDRQDKEYGGMRVRSK